MARKFQAPTRAKLADPDAEKIRENHDRRITELTSVPIVSGILVKDIVLYNATNTPIPHSFGRQAHVFVTPPRATSSATTGRIREIRDPMFDPKRYVVLKANGWGEPVTVDVWIF